MWIIQRRDGSTWRVIDDRTWTAYLAYSEADAQWLCDRLNEMEREAA